MTRLIVSRLPQMLIVTFLVTLLSFFLVNLLPGDVLHVILGEAYSDEAAAQLSQALHLNQPIFQRYLDWLLAALHGDLGVSLITHQSVGKSLWTAAGPTLELVIGAQIISTVLALGFALGSVLARGQAVDRIGTGFALFASSVPSFVLGLLLLSLFAVHWHVVSAFGWIAPSDGGWGANLRAIALPCLILGVSVFPGHMRVLRSELHEQLEVEEYVTLGRIKGVGSWRLMTRHVLRNSAFGLITITAFSTGLLVAGAVLIEQIFAIPGVGSLILTAINDRDSPTVEGCVALLAVIIVVLNLLADVAYALVDPRVRSARS